MTININSKSELAKTLQDYLEGTGLGIRLYSMLCMDNVFSGISLLTQLVFLAEINNKSFSMKIYLQKIDPNLVQGFSSLFETKPCCMYDGYYDGLDFTVLEWRRYDEAAYVERITARGVENLVLYPEFRYKEDLPSLNLERLARLRALLLNYQKECLLKIA